MNKKFLIYVMLGMILMPILNVSCNEKGSIDEPTVAKYSSSTLVSEFSLQKDDSVLSNLDSVHFSIDLERGLIYNADSLPKGTKISALKVTVTYDATAKAEFTVKGGEVMKDTTFTYEKADTIDFTGDVVLSVKSQDELFTKNYTIKINVHQMEADSMYWSEQERADLSQMSGEATEQKTVLCDGTIYSLVQTTAGYYLSSTTNPESGSWTVNAFSDFTPQVASLTASSDALYVLSDEGTLYMSLDGASWASCGVTWQAIVGGYAARVLGIKNDGGKLMHDEYPTPAGFVPQEVEPTFPVEGYSDLVPYSNSWELAPQSLMIGGVDRDGKYHGDAWAYDGSVWACIAPGAVPARAYIPFAQYYTYYTNKSNWTYTKQVCWLTFGGKNGEGEVDNVVRMSQTQGLIWTRADASLQYGAGKGLYGAQAIVWNATLTPATRASQEINEWECPYIYVFGGYNVDGKFNTKVRRGVIARMGFKPIQ